MYFLSNDILKLAVENNELTILRDWLYLRCMAAQNSGHFNIRSLPLNFLGYNLKDSSNFKKFGNTRYKMYKASMFFKHLKNDLFQIISEKKLLLLYKESTSTRRYAVPEHVLHSKKLFLDFCIGIYLSDTTYSNKNIAKVFNVTVRRIQQATSRNNTSLFFLKEHRKVIEYFDTHEKALRRFQELQYLGIHCDIDRINSEYIISVNTSNKYRSNVIRRKKGRIRKDKLVKRDRMDNWFKPAFKGKNARTVREKYENRLNAKVLMFNEPVYSLGDFVSTHSTVL